jgi:RNA polymerase sigma-70 factor (ECF subfamily)
MEDSQIITLYWQRDEAAIAESSRKYGIYCRTVADNILHCPQDAEECVNDTWLRAWNAMPPEKPSVLRLFFARITRNLSLSCWRRKHADKRGGGEMPLLLEELGDCVSNGDSVFEEYAKKTLAEALQQFLWALPMRDRTIFLKRYFYAMSVSDIARQMGMTENNVSKVLSRTREKLKHSLEVEDV